LEDPEFASPRSASGGDVHKVVRISHSERLEEQRVDQPEDRGVRADPERQRDDGGQRECRRPAHRAQGIAKIGVQAIDQREASGVAARILPLRHAAELLPCPSFRVDPRESLSDEIGGASVDMESHLGVHFALHATPMEPRAAERFQRGKKSHDRVRAAQTSPGVASSTNPIAPERRSQ
jgi:hypothetical protein